MPDCLELTDTQGNKTSQLFGLAYTEMVLIKAKNTSFVMKDIEGNENPITFRANYHIGAYPVTQELWQHVMGQNPSHFKGKHRPVEMVSWDDICKQDGFLDRLNALAQQTYPDLKGNFALPYEAQWMYAAAEGPISSSEHGYRYNYYAYAGGNDVQDVGWFKGNNDIATMPVGINNPML